MAWDVLDFVVFGAMIAAVAFIYAYARRRSENTAYRTAFGVALAAAFLLIWINAAVGIIGSEDNDANAMYFGVLAVGIVGAVAARLQPRGMAIALTATALAQAAVTAVAIVNESGASAPMWPNDVLTLNGFFVALWLLSAWLFRRAASTPYRAR